MLATTFRNEGVNFHHETTNLIRKAPSEIVKEALGGVEFVPVDVMEGKVAECRDRDL